LHDRTRPPRKRASTITRYALVKVWPGRRRATKNKHVRPRAAEMLLVARGGDAVPSTRGAPGMLLADHTGLPHRVGAAVPISP
jgi:hypothetical protein